MLTPSAQVAPVVDTVRGQFPALSAVESDAAHLDAAIEWIFRSQDVGDTDGSAAGYNLVTGWQDPYPETTGYLIPTLYRYSDQTETRQAADRATAMAEWLLTTQLPDGGFPGGTGVGDESTVFNTGQIVLGLADAYERTDLTAFRDAVTAAADWLVDGQNADGTWTERTYNSHAHDYHARVAWALTEAAEVAPVRSEMYRDAARANIETTLEHQHPNGWFENASFGGGSTAFLHTIAYTARGLIEAGERLDSERAFGAGRRTADALLEQQTQVGILRGEYDADWNGSWYYCLPGNAQMAALWLRLYQLTEADRYLSAGTGTIAFLKRHQALSGSDPVRGALAGSYPIFGKYVYLRYPNWGAKFFADALLEREAVLRETTESEPTEFVAADDRTDDAGGTGVCRVCLLVDGEYVMRWAAEAIQTMLSETNAEISLVVINEDDGLLNRGNVKRGLKYPAYAAVTVATLVRDSFTDGQAYDDDVHIADIEGVADAPWIRTYPARVDGFWNELPDDIIARVAAESDLVVRRGFGLLSGDILSATEYGVLSYHHGDPREYRGGPAGFWEYLHDRRHAGAIVQTLTDELDAGIVQASTDIAIEDCESWGEVRELLYTESTDLLAEAVDRLQDEESEPETVDSLGPVYHPPSTFDLGRYVFRQVTDGR